VSASCGRRRLCEAVTGKTFRDRERRLARIRCGSPSCAHPALIALESHARMLLRTWGA
jgi:hypothetical protein